MRVDASACDALAEAVAAAYDVAEPVSCRFLRHGFNDHFRVTTGGGELHLRVYLDGKYYISGDDDLLFELSFARGLADNGVPVAPPVVRADGGLLSVVELSVGPRRFAVFEVAPGAPPEDPTRDLARAFGIAMAQIHTVGDALGLPPSRYHLDERYLIDAPLDQLRTLQGVDQEVAALADIGNRIKNSLATLPRSAPLYGPIHGDPHSGNLHVDSDGDLRIFDFDHCAFGWRAYDLATCRMVLREEPWREFLGGYTTLRAVTDVELEHLPVLSAARAIWDVGDVLAMRTAWGTDDVSERLAARLPQMVERLQALGV